LRRRSIRQPSARCRPEISNGTGGSSIRRSKRPYGISIRRIRAFCNSRGNGRSPLTTRVPAFKVTVMLSSSTPGKAIRMVSASAVSKTSIGASQ